MDATLFGWIHISDIHFGHGGTGYAPNQKLVLDELVRDVGLNPPKARIDAVFVTGDVAFSGEARPGEYAAAEKWLLDVAAAARVDPAQIYVVPGNHDVNRKVDEEDGGVGPLVELLRDGKREIDEQLAKPKARKALAERMAGFLAFAAQFGPWRGRAPLPEMEERLFWKHSLAARGGLTVRIAGLNTAILAKDRDEGRLELGERQISETLDPAAPGELVLALSHHPARSGWLRDEKGADGWLKRRAHAHLSGHVHEAETEYAGSGGGASFVRLVAGAAHGERLPEKWIPATHGYSYGEVYRGNDSKLVLRVHPRIWSEKKKFVRDMNGVPDDRDFAEHPLDVTLPASAVAAFAPSDTSRGEPVDKASAPSIAAAGPIEVVVFSAPEDEDMRELLEKHLAGLVRKGVIVIHGRHTIEAGAYVEETMVGYATTGRVFIVLVSASFLAAEDYEGAPLGRVMARMAQGDATVIPIYLRPCDWEETWLFARHPLHGFDAAGNPAFDRKGKPKAISQSDQDVSLMKVAKALGDTVRHLATK